MYGEQNNNSLPFTQGEMLSKNLIRDKNGKVLCAAILDTWIKHKSSSVVVLASLFGEKGIHLPERNESNSVANNTLVAELEIDATPAPLHGPLRIVHISKDESITNAMPNPGILDIPSTKDSGDTIP